MSRLCPRQCIATYGSPPSATTAAMSGSASPPHTSLTTTAPASSAAAATAGPHGVDADQRSGGREVAHHGQHPARPPPRPAPARAPGRVDSPPTSTRSAPSREQLEPVRDRGVVVEVRPPSENESGVTLTTPITSVRSSAGCRRSGRSRCDDVTARR